MNISLIDKNIIKSNYFWLNPLIIFNIAIIGIFTLYSFRWSDLLPKLSIDLIIFFLIVFFFNIVLAYYISIKISTKIIQVKNPSFSLKTLLVVTFALVLCFIWDYFKNDGIPLLKMFFSDQKYDYRNIVFTEIFSALYKTFSIAFAIIIFNDFLNFRKPIYLIIISIILINWAFFISRGVIILIVLTFLFQYLNVIKFTFKKIIIGFAIFVMCSYLFGYFGNIRETAKVDKEKYLSFVEISKVNQNYPKYLPFEFLWIYQYLTTPLANFQVTVNSYNGQKDIKNLILSECLPETVSKRIYSLLNYSTETEIATISKHFTVGTIFAKSFVFAGWLGASILYFTFVFFLGLPILIANKYFDRKWVSIVIPFIIVLSALSLFDNFIANSISAFVIFWFFFFAYIENKRLPL
jgi:hypothetical protein